MPAAQVRSACAPRRVVSRARRSGCGYSRVAIGYAMGATSAHWLTHRSRNVSSARARGAHRSRLRLCSKCALGRSMPPTHPPTHPLPVRAWLIACQSRMITTLHALAQVPGLALSGQRAIADVVDDPTDDAGASQETRIRDDTSEADGLQKEEHVWHCVKCPLCNVRVERAARVAGRV